MSARPNPMVPERADGGRKPPSSPAVRWIARVVLGAFVASPFVWIAVLMSQDYGHWWVGPATVGGLLAGFALFSWACWVMLEPPRVIDRGDWERTP